jgi:aminopeptidase-like protein
MVPREKLGMVDLIKVGKQMHALACELHPICRSITGDGVRETLKRIAQEVPIEVHEVPSGTQVHDWVVPDEWNIRDAWIKGPDGQKVVDFSECNLHVVGYSLPISAKMPLCDLLHHLHSLPDQMDWIPYRTAYYCRSWGFCIAQRKLDQLQEGIYEVFIDSELTAGSLSYGELIIPGQTSDEFLISCHVCHPSLANDNLSGIVVAVALARYLMLEPRRLTARFVFIPGTIGSIAWLALNGEVIPRIMHGLVLTCVGDIGDPTYKRSRRGNAEIDRVMEYIMRQAGVNDRVLDFVPYGYDERQYCSAGFNLPVGVLSRSVHGTFPEYHTSADDMTFIKPECLADSLSKALSAIEMVESNGTYQNLKPMGEPMLGRVGLYDKRGGGRGEKFTELAMLWVLNLSDGKSDLLSIAERSGIDFCDIVDASLALEAAGLLQRMGVDCN